MSINIIPRIISSAITFVILFYLQYHSTLAYMHNIWYVYTHTCTHMHALVNISRDHTSASF